MERLYFNGTILTMEDPPQVQAMLCRGSRIMALGTLEGLSAAAPRAQRIDLEGRTLLPAFVDPHSHLTAVGRSFYLADLGGCHSFAQLVEALERFAAAQPGEREGRWLMGFAYDHNQLEEKAHPTRLLLDRAFPRRPVLITHQSGHMAVANTPALEALGLTPHTPDPEGGRLGRLEDGSLSGYLEENAFFECAQRIPALTPQEQRDGIRRAQELYFSHGITTFQEGAAGEEELEVLKGMAQEGLLQGDVVAYLELPQGRALARANPRLVGQYRGRLKIGGYKIFLDGSPQGRTAWLSQPYQGEVEYRGYPTHTDGEVEEFVRQALEDRMQLLSHCNGDAAAGQLLDACRRAGDTRPIRPVMIHAQTVRPSQLARMAPLGMIPSFFAAHLYYLGEIHRKNLGESRAGAISPAATAAGEGLPFTLHQDSPVFPPDMLHTVWCAVNRVTQAGRELGRGERITPLEALRGVTIHAAHQYFEEGEKGSLRQGKLANLVILEENPLAVPPEHIRDIRVLETVREGETVWRRT